MRYLILSSEDFYNEHRIINIRTESEILKFEIFSVYTEPSDWDYIKTDFSSKEEFKRHLIKLKSKSMYKSDVTLSDDEWTYEFSDIPIFNEVTGEIIRYVAVETEGTVCFFNC